jgi:hypothetical protein
MAWIAALTLGAAGYPSGASYLTDRLECVGGVRVSVAPGSDLGTGLGPAAEARFDLALSSYYHAWMEELAVFANLALLGYPETAAFSTGGGVVTERPLTTVGRFQWTLSLLYGAGLSLYYFGEFDKTEVRFVPGADGQEQPVRVKNEVGAEAVLGLTGRAGVVLRHQESRFIAEASANATALAKEPESGGRIRSDLFIGAGIAF